MHTYSFHTIKYIVYYATIKNIPPKPQCYPITMTLHSEVNMNELVNETSKERVTCKDAMHIKIFEMSINNWKFNFPITRSVRRSVGWLVGRSVGLS